MGEITAGLHGANRLGGNSLAETVVFGKRAGEAAARRSLALDVQLRSRHVIAAAADELDAAIQDGDTVVRQVQRELRDTLWDHVGIARTEDQLTAGIERIRELYAAALDIDVHPDAQGYADLAAALDLRGSIGAAEATALLARERRESRGANIRTDFPDRDDEHHQVNHTVRFSDGQLEVGSRPRPAVPDHLQEWMRKADELDVGGRLLE